VETVDRQIVLMNVFCNFRTPDMVWWKPVRFFALESRLRNGEAHLKLSAGKHRVGLV
jgi:hypothetical protein